MCVLKMHQRLLILLATCLLSGCYTSFNAANPSTHSYDAQSINLLEPPSAEATVTEDRAPVFQQPDATSAVVTRLAMGDSFDAYGYKGGYVLIGTSREGQLGYVLSRTIDTNGMLSNLRDTRGRARLEPGDEGYVDPQTATLVGVLVPGGGQLYAGETGKGALLLSFSIAAPLLSTQLAMDSVSDDCSDGYCTGTEGFSYLYAGLGVSVGAWAIGLATASNDARQANRRNATLAASPVAIQAPNGPIRPGVRLSVNW